MSASRTSSSTSSSSSRIASSVAASVTTPPTSSPILSITSTPSPTTTTPTFGGGGSGGNPNGSSIASSASLYLYTFLATLVLLLSVSAAIVVRSFLLRRRHRRMIEEAIRNGTWIPSTQGGRGGPKVDLSKKPVMWEAYLDFHNQTQNQIIHQHMISDERDWDSMKPVMATYVNEPVAKKTQNASSGGPGSVRDEPSADGGGDQSVTGGMATPRRVLGVVTRRVRGILRTSPSGPTLPLAHPVSNGSGRNTRQGSAVNLVTEVPMSEIVPPEPARVRVAVLIAMPRPHSTPSSSSASSSSSSPAAAAVSQPPFLSSEDEEELPLIEMGVAELNVSDSHLSEMGVDGVQHGGKGKVRESMASAGSL